jgi:hypothetical protein
VRAADARKRTLPLAAARTGTKQQQQQKPAFLVKRKLFSRTKLKK